MKSVGVFNLAGGMIVLSNRRGTPGTSGAHEERRHAVSVTFTHPVGIRDLPDCEDRSARQTRELVAAFPLFFFLPNRDAPAALLRAYRLAQFAP